MLDGDAVPGDVDPGIGDPEVLAGSKSKSVAPSAPSSLPQFGSPPKNADLTRAESATSRPAFLARASLVCADYLDGHHPARRPRRRRRIGWRDPSKPGSWRLRASTYREPRRSAPEARAITVSFVEGQPSMLSAWNDSSTAARSAVSSVGRIDHGVGGDHNQHGCQVGPHHAGTLGHSPDRESSPQRWSSPSGTVSVVMIGSSGSGACCGIGGEFRHLPRRCPRSPS